MIRGFEKLNYELEFITPAFIGGAEQGISELRPASIVGMLRYWFRIIAGSYVKDTEKLFELESELFGDQKKAGKVWVRVRGNVYIVDRDELLTNFYEKYLFGIKRGKLIKPGSVLKLQIMVFPKYKDLVDYIVRFAFTFGNLGYRARKGFGSLDFDRKIEKIDIELIEKLLTESFDKELSFQKNKGFPNLGYAIFYKKSELSQNELQNLGEIYHTFRRENKRTHEYLNFVGKFLRKQHINFKKVSLKNHMFGLPIMYSSRSKSCKKGRIRAQAQLNWRAVKNEEGDNRRPAPFWISIKKDSVFAVLFKSEFLPLGSELILSPKGKYWKICEKTNPPQQIFIKNPNINFSILENFFDFAGFKEIWRGKYA